MKMNKQRLIESGIEKIVRKVMNEGTGNKWLTKRQYNQARKGIELMVNSLFDLENVAVDDPDKSAKRKTGEEIRSHVVAIREIIDGLV